MKAIIKSVQGKNAVIEFTFDDKTKSTQTIANVPVHDEALATEFLTNYAEAYQHGKEIEKKLAEAPVVAEWLLNKQLDLKSVSVSAEPEIVAPEIEA